MGLDIYTINVIVRDDDLGEARANPEVTVNNVPPSNVQLCHGYDDDRRQSG